MFGATRAHLCLCSTLVWTMHDMLTGLNSTCTGEAMAVQTQRCCFGTLPLSPLPRRACAPETGWIGQVVVREAPVDAPRPRPV